MYKWIVNNYYVLNESVKKMTCSGFDYFDYCKP